MKVIFQATENMKVFRSSTHVFENGEIKDLTEDAAGELVFDYPNNFMYYDETGTMRTKQTYADPELKRVVKDDQYLKANMTPRKRGRRAKQQRTD